MTDMDEAILFARMRSLDDTDRLSYAERGRILKTVMNSMLHLQRIDPETGDPCSWTRWVRMASPWSYAQSFAAYRDIEALSDVPMEHLAKIPEANIKTLIQLSTKVRNEPAVLLAAQTQNGPDFIQNIKRVHPEQHIEAKRTFRFVADESQAAEIQDALDKAMERGAMNLTEALLMLAVNYRADLLMEELHK
jgi:hypothetical protein